MLRYAWLWFLAFCHLNDEAVCRLSAQGGRDYHDYQDDDLGQPAHFVVLYCRRCGKAFTI